MEARLNNGGETMVDPNQVKMNSAGTNMQVACYPEKNLDRGNREPQFINWHHITFLPEDKKIMEEVFKRKAAEMTAWKKKLKKIKKQQRTSVRARRL